MRLPLVPLPLESVVAAGIERELAPLEMQDVVDDIVEQIALVADHDEAAAIGLEEILQPQPASRSRWFDGSSSSSRSGSENSSAASATRIRQPPEKAASGWCCASSSKPSPARMRAARAGAAWASIAISRSWISPMRCAIVDALGLSQQLGALGIGGEHGLERRRLAARRFLRDIADARAARRLDPPASASIMPAITFSSVDLPAPLRPISPTRALGGSAAVA